VVSLGHALGLMVVAECVETADEAQQLYALGCDLGQGYYFAPPLPREQAEAYIRRQHQGAA
jgi:EAL domain-containing protein (putative c-di-GMP-specific phosphodiesterase class I)